jgi:uncharacterized protein with HEPN domain
MNRDDEIRLRHLADALDYAMRFARGRDLSDLGSDEMLLFALVRAIEIAGEAASEVSEETRAALPDLPWASMIGMRNRLVHAYSTSIGRSSGRRSRRRFRRLSSA